MTQLLSTIEAAQRLRIHPTTLATWRVEGRGPKFVKIGVRKVGYRESDVEAWLDKQTRTSTVDR